MKLGRCSFLVIGFLVGRFFGNFVIGALKFLLFLVKYPFLKKKYKFLGPHAAFQLCADYDIGRYYVTTMVIMKDKVDFEAFCKFSSQRVKGLTAFSHCVKFLPFGWPYFEPISDWKFKDNAFEHVLKEGTREEAQKKIAELQSHSMSMGSPLYEFHVIQNYLGDKSIILLNTHHSICDGFSLVKFLLHFSEKKNEEDTSNFTKKKKKGKVREKISFLSKAFKFVTSLIKILTVPKDPEEMRLGHRGGLPSRNFQCGTSYLANQFSLPAIKSQCKLFKVSFNDFVMSVITGGLRKYVLHHGVGYDVKMLESGKSKLTTLMLVNMRKTSMYELIDVGSIAKSSPMNPDGMDVQMSAIINEYPIHIEDHMERLVYLNRTFRKFLHSPEPLLAVWLMTTLSYFPGIVMNFLFKTLIHKTSCSTSNVPGPQHCRTIAGVDIDGIGFFVGPQGTYSEMISIFSYDSKVMVTLTSVFDQEDTDLLLKFIQESMDEHMALQV